MFETRSTSTARSSERTTTSEHLLITAERLFAEHGIAGVSLRQIATAAGQRNPAVVQYHFGSKENLIRDVIEFRLAEINERRLALLSGRPRTGINELRRIIRAVVVPLFELDPHSTSYTGFLASLSASPHAFAATFDAVDEVRALSGRVVAQRLNTALGEMPTAIRKARTTMVFRHLLSALSTRHQDVRQGLDDGLDDDTFLDNLIETAVALLRAPTHL